jgi:hypothetical protein
MLTWIIVCCTAARSQIQAPPDRPRGTASLEIYLLESLKQPKYDSLDAQQKRLLLMLASSAAVIVDTERCADPSASGSAAESVIGTLAILRRRTPTVLEVPRKAELIDFAMDIESMRPPEQDLTGVLCHGQVLPDSTVKSSDERRAVARQVLSLGLSPPQSATVPPPQ